MRNIDIPWLWTLVGTRATSAPCSNATLLLVSRKPCSWARDTVDPRWYLVVVLLVTAYYLCLYLLVHRARIPVPLVPSYSPPQNLSPAALRYLFTGDSDRKTVAAVLLHLAARGLISIRCRKNWYLVEKRTERLPANLPAEEAAAFSVMFLHPEALPTDRLPDEPRVSGMSDMVAHVSELGDVPPGVFPLHPLAGLNFHLLARRLHTVLRTTHEKTFFRRNLIYCFPAILLSIFGVVFAAFPWPAAAYVTAFIAAGVLATHYTPYVHDLLHHRIRRVGDDAGMIVLVLVYATVIAGLGANVNQFFVPFELSLLFVIVANFLIPPLLRVCSATGRRILPQIEGYREFLARVELDRFQRDDNLGWAPGPDTENMAYAVALDLDGAWQAYLARSDFQLLDFSFQSNQNSREKSDVGSLLGQLTWRHLVLFAAFLILLFARDFGLLAPVITGVVVLFAVFLAIRKLARLRT
jgi:hypothetical protein